MNQEITCPQCGLREILAKKKQAVRAEGAQTFTHHECEKHPYCHDNEDRTANGLKDSENAQHAHRCRKPGRSQNLPEIRLRFLPGQEMRADE